MLHDLVKGYGFDIDRYSPDLRAAVEAAQQSILHWYLVNKGLATYQQLGYGTVEGAVSPVKAREYIVIQGTFERLVKEKQSGGDSKRRL